MVWRMVMDFSSALMLLREGRRVARTGWNGEGMWVELYRPNAHSKMTLPYLFLCYPQDAKRYVGDRVPWLASQTDLLAKDWVEIHPEPNPGVSMLKEVASLIARQLSENPIPLVTDCTPFAREILREVGGLLRAKGETTAGAALEKEAGS
jgi:hypothetical protein